MASSSLEQQLSARTDLTMAELTHSRPRDVALTGGGRALVVFAVVLFMAAIGAGVGMYNAAVRHAGEQRAIVEEGVTTTGVVTRLRSDGDDRRRVGYEFGVNGRVVRGDRQVSGERRRTLKVGSPVDVRYLPSDPTVNESGRPSALGHTDRAAIRARASDRRVWRALPRSGPSPASVAVGGSRRTGDGDRPCEAPRFARRHAPVDHVCVSRS